MKISKHIYNNLSQKLLRNFVSEVKDYLYLTDEWLSDNIDRHIEEDDEIFDVMLLSKCEKLQDLISISMSQLKDFLDDYSELQKFEIE